MDPILARLATLGRRRRRLVVARAMLLAGATLVAGWLSLVLAANTLGPFRGAGWLAVVVTAALLAGIATARSGRFDLRFQAERVEELRPELRGALVTVVDRAARPLGSSAVLALLSEQVAPVVATLPAAQAWGWGPVREAARLLCAGLLALSVTALALREGPLDVLATLLSPAAPAVATELPPADQARALVGDITLRYLYPTYTGLEPVDVPNSTGEVRAPPGTTVEVRARAAQVQETAAILVYGELLPATLEGGRQVAARFTVAGEGTWRVEFGSLPSPDYRILPDPDLAPVVALQTASRRVSIPSDGRLALRYSVRDDYGIARVVAEVKVGSEAREVELRTPIGSPRELGDELSLSATDLGIPVGQRAAVRVGAWDNDAVSGSKVGWSATVQVEVLGAQGSRARQLAFWRQGRDALLGVLAPTLLDGAPVRDEGAELVAWAPVLEERYVAFEEVLDAFPDVCGSGLERSIVEEVLEGRQRLSGFALVASAGLLKEKDTGTLVDLQADHLDGVERAILVFDALLHRRVMEDLMEVVQALASEADELRRDAPRLSTSASLARLDQLRRALDGLGPLVADLERGPLRDLVEDRAAEADAVARAARAAVGGGRAEEGRVLLNRLAETLRDLSGGIEELQKQGKKQGDDAAGAMQRLDADLRQLLSDQAAAREKVSQARKKFAEGLEDAVQAWARVEELARQVAAATGDTTGAVGEARSADRGLSAALRDARDDASGLRDSARARDLQAARERASNTVGSLARARSRAQAVARRGGEGARAAGETARRLDVQLQRARQAEQQLDRMAERTAGPSPELEEQLREQATAQRALSGRADALRQQATQVARQLPIPTPGLERGTAKAASQAGRAEEALRDADAMSGEGAMQSAEDGIQEALQALRDASRAMRGMGKKGEGSPSAGEDDDGAAHGGPSGEQDSRGEIRIPAPEEFETNEAYRRALLEAQKQAVPQQYRALNRRYYEELVRQ
jgi:hypothetical protein